MKNPEPDMDWDPLAAVDEEAAVEAEIKRRRRAREEVLKRASGSNAVAPAIQALQGSDSRASTPASTRNPTPGPQRTEANTPRSSKSPTCCYFSRIELTLQMIPPRLHSPPPKSRLHCRQLPLTLLTIRVLLNLTPMSKRTRRMAPPPQITTPQST